MKLRLKDNSVINVDFWSYYKFHITAELATIVFIFGILILMGVFI